MKMLINILLCLIFVVFFSFSWQQYETSTNPFVEAVWGLNSLIAAVAFAKHSEKTLQ